MQKAVASQALEEEEAGMDDVEVHNSPVVKRINAEERKRRCRKLLIILVVLAVIILVAALGGGLGSKNGSSSSQNESGDNNGPTSNDVSSFITSLAVSDISALADPSSPQYAALNWLKSNSANAQYQFETSLANNTELQLIAKERYAAATLYYSLGGSAWINNSGWLSSASVCEWYGILCLLNTTNVQGLSLDEKSLTGTIPKEIQIFSDLVKLDLWGNDIVGSIPTSLFSLTKLQYLDLTSNSLTGQIPSQIGQLSGLAYLYLGGNRFSGTIPTELGRLTLLEDLWMDNNSYNSDVARIPSEIGNLSMLTRLRMINMGGYGNYGGIGGTIPSEIGRCKQLGTYLF
jgi:Leucine-rich repeat (LRR) protein